MVVEGKVLRNWFPCSMEAALEGASYTWTFWYVSEDVVGLEVAYYPRVPVFDERHHHRSPNQYNLCR